MKLIAVTAQKQWTIEWVRGRKIRGKQMNREIALAKLKRKGCTVFRDMEHFDMERDYTVDRLDGFVLKQKRGK